MSIKVIPDLIDKYIRGTPKKSIVQLVEVFLCHLTSSTAKGINCPCKKVYVGTRVLKHIYDKRPAEEFDFLVEHVHSVVKYPNRIYRNKGGKRGSYIFIKQIKNETYLCSIETVQNEEQCICQVVTFFRVEESYLKGFELLWEWKDGIPSS